MGCTGSKDKNDGGDMGAAPSMEKDKEAKEKLDKSHAFLSADLRTLMHDYFNRCELLLSLFWAPRLVA